MRCLAFPNLFPNFFPNLLALILATLAAGAQEAPLRSPADGPFLPAPALKDGKVLALYPPDSPKLNQKRIHEAEKYNTTSPKADRLLTTLNVHNPSIEVHLVPDGVENTGTTVIVAPGGGHWILWVGPEGYDLVSFLGKRGISTVVLRNRLRADGYEPTTDSVDDAFQAIRLVRKHAKEWRIDPARIGIIGFSAGAELSAPTALFFKKFEDSNNGASDPLSSVSARPDFVGLIYPGPSPFAKGAHPEIPVNAPPSFVASAGSGDKVHALWAAEYFTPMLERGIPNVEMHIYGNGSHGGSINEQGGIPYGTWSARYLDWLKDLGFLSSPGTETKAAKDVAKFAKSPPPEK